METVNPIEYASLDEIVFETRNRSYGAYLLRKVYHHHLGMSLLIATALCLVLVNLPGWMNTRVEKVIPVKPPISDNGQTVETTKPVIEVPPKKSETFRRVKASTTGIQITTQEVLTEEKPTEVSLLPGLAGLADLPGVDPHFDADVPEGFGEAPFVKEAEKTIYDFVAQMPEFPGGDAALIRFLNKNIRYPQVAQRMGVEGKVFLQFVVSRDGSIIDVQVVKGVSKECDEEAVRVVKAMPAWKPGKQNNMPVAVRFTFPIFFKMSE
jgi:protein TonB